jgi:hypothetical protein
MRDVVRLPLDLSADRLREDLARVQSEDWVPHFNRQYYEGDWSAVPLRSLGGEVRKIYPDPTRDDYADTPILERCPYVAGVLRGFRCPLRAVRFLRLAAGSRIREHTDYNLGFDDGQVRIHVPVATNPQVEFFLNGCQIVMHEGEAWYLNFNLPHRLYNGGSTDRVHLVIDCQANEWIREQLMAASLDAEGPR